MKIHIRVGILVVLCTLILFSACHNPIAVEVGDTGYTSTEESWDQPFSVGAKLDNPYSLESMQATNARMARAGLTLERNLEATHLYIKFIPRNGDDVSTLALREDLDLYNHPLDHSTSGSGSYRDPNVTDGNQPNSLYGAVEISAILPDVPYEILDKLYLPDEDDVLEQELEAESLARCGYSRAAEARRSRGKWTPSAKIQIYDDGLSSGSNKVYVPIEGVEVRVRNWFRSHQGYTNSAGEYRSGKTFRGDVAYYVKWEYKNEHFDIRDGYAGQAFYNGPNNKRSKWNLTLDNGIQWFYGTCFKASAYLLTKDTSVFGTNPYKYVSVCALDKDGTRRLGRYTPKDNDIWVYRNYSDGGRRGSRSIFNTTVHEFGHHIMNQHHTWASVDDNLHETWGEVVGYVFTEDLYGINERLFDNHEESMHDQDWTSGDYTPLMIDLIDTYNQYYKNRSYLNDKVRGYTLNQFFTIIKKDSVKTLDNFIKEVKKLPVPSSTTQANRDDYLNQY